MYQCIMLTTRVMDRPSRLPYTSFAWSVRQAKWPALCLSGYISLEPHLLLVLLYGTSGCKSLLSIVLSPLK